MASLLLLFSIMILYAGYNLFIKVSGSHVPVDATTTILATICLQLAALGTSGVFAGLLLARGGQVLQLPSNTFLWAAAAGVCIGGAEIGYFYLFSGTGLPGPMAASRAIPIIVSGTIVITLLVAFPLFGEALGWPHYLGSGCIVLGLLILLLGKAAPATAL